MARTADRWRRALPRDWVSTAYLSELPPRFFEVPVLWIHGHTHSSHDYRVGRLPGGVQPARLPAAGYGRPENPGFDAQRDRDRSAMNRADRRVMRHMPRAAQCGPGPRRALRP